MIKLSKITFFLLLFAASAALADTITFNTVVGDYHTNQTTVGGVHGIQITAYYYKNGAWHAADLFGRNQAPNDVGVGICDPGETTHCGTGAGGGDFNEISNNVYPEVIRLTLAAGYRWTSVQLSSLDNNGGGEAEHGELYSSSSGNPGAPGSIGNHICNFAALTTQGIQTCVTTGGTNPVISIGLANQNSQFLFLEARDWNMLSNHNNDFLLRAATITNVVPEPGTFALLGSGLLGMAGAVRRRFKK